jgi:hypothetical protein
MRDRDLFLGLLTVILLLIVLTDTPQAAPLPELSQGSQEVVLSEIAWMGTTTSSTDEWIELYNNTSSPSDLTGWTLSAADGTPSIPLSGSIPAAGYFLLERTDDTTVPDLPADQTYSGGLGNGGEDVILQDAGSNLIDRVDCSSGWFAGHAEARVRMAAWICPPVAAPRATGRMGPAVARPRTRPASLAPAP